MRFWSDVIEISAPGARYWSSVTDWQRGFGPTRGDSNEDVYLVHFALESFPSDAPVAVDLVRQTLRFDGALGPQSTLLTVNSLSEGGEAADWASIGAFQRVEDVYMTLYTEYNAATATVDYVSAAWDHPESTAAPTTTSLIPGMPEASLVEFGAFTDYNDFVASVRGVESAGGVDLVARPFDLPELSPTDSEHTIATLPPDAGWRVDGWNNTRFSLLNEAPGGDGPQDVRMRVYIITDVAGGPESDFAIPSTLSRIDWMDVDYFDEVAGEDTLAIFSGQTADGGDRLDFILGSIADPNGDGFSFFERNRASLDVSVEGDPTFTVLNITDPALGAPGVFVYYLDDGVATARRYFAETATFGAPLVIADDITRDEFGNAIPFGDGRYMLTWTDNAADETTSGYYGRIVDLREGVLDFTADDSGQRYASGPLDDVLTGGLGADELAAGAGADTLSGGADADLLSGGAGEDWVSYNAAAIGVQIDLGNGNGVGGEAEGDMLRDIEHATMSNGDDGVWGSEGANTVYLWSGADYADGRGGNDNLHGGLGDDTLVGGAADDLLEGGAGADWLNGGEGLDWVSYNASADGVQVDIGFSNGIGGEAEGDGFAGVDNVTASNAADGVWGTDGANEIFLWQGADYADGRDGDDRIFGGWGVDTVQGGAGNDWLYGEGDGDGLGGGAGQDNLIGGLGDDWMWGGAGSDAFWIDLASLEAGGHDRIMDFEENSPAAADWIRFDGVRYDQIIWYEQESAAVIQVALDDGGSHYVEIMNFTLAQLADQYYGHG